MEVEQGPDPDRLELPWRTLATVRGRWEAGLSPCKGTQAWLCGGGGMQGPANKAKGWADPGPQECPAGVALLGCWLWGTGGGPSRCG